MQEEIKKFLSIILTGIGIICIIIGCMASSDVFAFKIAIILILLGGLLLSTAWLIPDFFVFLWNKFLKKQKIIPPHLLSPEIWVFFTLPSIICFPLIFCIISDFIDKGNIFELLPIFIPVLLLTIFYLIGIYAIKGNKEIYTEVYNYLEENKVSLGLFTRPYSTQSNIIIANKYLILEYDIRSFVNKKGAIELTDKINHIVYRITGFKAKYTHSGTAILRELFFKFDYETGADELLKKIPKSNWTKITKIKTNAKIYLDINQASEAELTAIPGVTIAKAKHAAKVRREQKLFLTMNQFYKAINLDEEFIEQVQTKGNKILLNELPEYKRIEKKD